MIKRGQIFFVDLGNTEGREQSGKRPVLIVSDDAINNLPLVVVVVIGTKSSNVKRDYPTNVRMFRNETGLPLDTVFLCFQVRSLDLSRFIDPASGNVKPAGQAPTQKMVEVDQALRLTLNL